MKSLILAALLAPMLSASADSVVVFNEIMYHPQTNEAAFEWVELHNQMAVDVDLSSWTLENAVSFTFPEGTVIAGGGYLVVALSPLDLRAATGLTNLLGPFAGRLSNAGDTLELRNNNHRLVDSVSYGVDDDWPVAPDGAGPSLAKFWEEGGSAIASNWCASAQVGGTPGVPNFPTRATNGPAGAALSLALNEMAAVTNTEFWVEIINYGAQSVALGNCVLARLGSTNREYLIPAQVLPAGGYALLDRATLGFGADPGDQVVLYGPGKSNVLDALQAKRYPRARWPEGTGAWLFPTQTTPGASNVFRFHNEIVVNEVMYHARDLPAIAPVYYTNTLVTWSNAWRYNSSGGDLGSAWTVPIFDDSLWPGGRAAFYTNITTLPVTKGTTLALSNAVGQAITTYYFRTPFVLTNSLDSAQFLLTHVVDDGAIVYLNGTEIYRYGMAAGVVTAITRATTNIGVPGVVGPISLPADSLVAGSNLLAVEVHQYLPPPGSKDVAMAVELMVTGASVPATPSRPSPESWLELYNRSTNTVDLTGWRLDQAVSYTFPPGTALAPDSYLVVAKDVAYMQSNYPALSVLGPFTNKLSGSSDRIVLRDASGNPANDVHYYADVPWPSLADGGGSSLELCDPRADNSKPEAWAASDETAKSQWQTYTWRGVAAAEPAASPTYWKELVLGLLGDGEVWLDDVSVIESPAGSPRQLIQNGNFEAGMSAWRTLGTHRHSEVIVDPANPSNHVLRLVANGGTEHMHNHAETTLTNGAAIANGTEYEVSLRARWVAGCEKLNVRLYFNRLARTLQLATPNRNGTPGARNSRWLANLGPTFANLSHFPVVPATNQPVTVSVDAADPDGVTNLTLFYSVNGGAWQSSSLTASVPRSSLHATGIIPGQASASVVQFYVSARDSLGVVSTYPAGGTNSRALYKVNDGVALLPRLHTVRLLMPPGDADFLHRSTNVMSNEELGCTVIYDDREVFYQSKVHLQGSERGRDNSARVGFTTRLPADHWFRGVQDGFTVDRSGGYSGLGGRHDEILIKHAVNKAGGLPGMYDDLVQCFTPRASENSTGLLIMAKYGSVFLDSQYANGGDGEMYKLELIYYPTNTVVPGNPQTFKVPQPDLVMSTDIQDLGDDPESYRWTFLKENHAERDNYTPMVALAKAFSLTGTNLDTRLHQIMDVDEWMRAVAFLSLIGSDDMYTYGNSHNLIIYFRPQDQKGMAFLWDMDYEFVAATTKAFPGNGSATTYKIITTFPDNYRRYYNHLLDLSSVTGDATYMGQWAGRYAGLLGQNWGNAVNYLSQRAAYVRGSMPLTTPFAIANNAGNNFATSTNPVTLAGTAPLTVRDILVNGLPGMITWISLTNWTLNVPLPAYTNLLTLQGLDNHGRALSNAADTILITNLGVPPLRAVVINEWMADNAGPGGVPDPVNGRYSDWFELYNPNNIAVNLGGYYLTDLLSTPNLWAIPTNTMIAAHGFLLIWADNLTNLNAPGDLHANFQLSKKGDLIALYAPEGTLQHEVTFGAQFQNVSQGFFPDGNSNGFYFMTNWTPRSANQLGAPPAPSFATMTLQPDGSVSMTATTLPGRTYQLQYKNDLYAYAWTPLAPNHQADGGSLILTDAPQPQWQRFYRLILLP